MNKAEEHDLTEYKLTRLGNVKQFIYNGRTPHDWNADVRFAMNAVAFPVEYRPRTTFSTVKIIAGMNVVATLDFTSEGFIYLKTSNKITAGTWVTIHVCYI